VLSSEFEAVLEEGDGDVVTATVMDALLAATSKVSVGPIIVLGVAIVILAALATAFVTTARRKKRPSECAEQRGALESAERALHYWEAAVAHLREVDLEAGAHSGTGASGAAREFKYGHTDDMTGQEFAELLRRAVDGRNAAERYRDQCQADLVHCIAEPVVEPRITPYDPEPLRPTFDADAASPRQFSEDG
jgi:hypothetical protein